MDNLIDNFNSCSLNESLSQNFIDSIENKQQIYTLLKLYCNYTSNKSNIVLGNYINEENILSVEILGTENKISKIREKYTVVINNNKCYCNCKDFVFRCKRDDIVCKHICFLICKVSNIFDALFFKNKIISDENIKIIVNELNKKKSCINIQFKPKDVDIEENCQICYESFGKNKLVCCPKCKNCVHEKCMSIWIQKTKSANCIYCRDSWKDYKIISSSKLPTEFN